MREITLLVHCDACRASINETSEGSNAVTFTVGERQWEMDICHPCLGGEFFQEARPVVTEKKPSKAPKPHDCWCGKAFTSARGLSQHNTKMHGEDVK